MNSGSREEYLYWEYHLSASGGHYVDCCEDLSKKGIDYEEGWASFKNVLCITLGIESAAPDVEALMQVWINW